MKVKEKGYYENKPIFKNFFQRKLKNMVVKMNW